MVSRFVIALSVVARVAYAQPGEPPPVEPAPPVQVDPAQHDYDAAFDVFVAGDLGTAASRLDDVAAHATDPALASRARELARLARTLIGKRVRFAIGPESIVDKDAADKDDKVDGRTSFIVWTTMYGLYAGVVLIDDANIDDFRGGILDGHRDHRARPVRQLPRDRRPHDDRRDGATAYSLGMIEGFANAGFLAQPLGLDSSSERVQTTVLLSGAVGAIAGLAYGVEAKPTRGQVAFAGTLSVLGAAIDRRSASASSSPTSHARQVPRDDDARSAPMWASSPVSAFGATSTGRCRAGGSSSSACCSVGSSGLAAGALINGGDSSDGNDTAPIALRHALAGMSGWLRRSPCARHRTCDRIAQYAPVGPTARASPRWACAAVAVAMLVGSF